MKDEEFAEGMISETKIRGRRSTGDESGERRSRSVSNGGLKPRDRSRESLSRRSNSKRSSSKDRLSTSEHGLRPKPQRSRSFSADRLMKRSSNGEEAGSDRPARPVRRRSKELLSSSSDHGTLDRPPPRRSRSSDALRRRSSDRNEPERGVRRAKSNEGIHGRDRRARSKDPLSASSEHTPLRPKSLRQRKSDPLSMSEHAARPQSSRNLMPSGSGHGLRREPSRGVGRSSSDEGLRLRRPEPVRRLQRNSSDEGLSLRSSKGRRREFKNAVSLDTSGHSLNPRSLLKKCTSVGNLNLKRSHSGESLKGLSQRFLFKDTSSSKGNQTWDRSSAMGSSSKSSKRTSSMRNLFASMNAKPSEGVDNSLKKKTKKSATKSMRNLFSTIAKADHTSVKSEKSGKKKSFGQRFMARMQLRPKKTKEEIEAEDVDPDKDFLHIDEEEMEASNSTSAETATLPLKSCLVNPDSKTFRIKKTVRVNRRTRVRYVVSRHDYPKDARFDVWYSVKEIQQIHNRLTRKMKREGLPTKDFWVLEGNSKHTMEKVKDSMRHGSCLKKPGAESKKKRVSWKPRSVVTPHICREDFTIEEGTATWYSRDEIQDIQDELIANMQGDGVEISTNFWCLDEPQRKTEMLMEAETNPFDEIGLVGHDDETVQI